MDQSIEERIKSLEATVTALQTRVRDLEDIEAITRLQCAYGFYLEHWMGEEIIDLFADRPETEATFVEGTYLGIEGVRRYFGKMRYAQPEFLHMVMQVNPVITLGGDGLTAKGRWYGYGTICSTPKDGAVDPMYMCVVYEMEYVKEDGVWKILKLAFQMHYAYKTPAPMPKEAEPPKDAEPRRDAMSSMKLSPDVWAEFNTQYPSGFIYPIHFVHPVTGKPTDEASYNAKLDLKPSPFLKK